MFSTKRDEAFSEGPCPCKSQLSSGSRLPLRNTTATSNSICHNSSLAVHPFGGSTLRNDEFDSSTKNVNSAFWLGISPASPRVLRSAFKKGLN
ncbi:hypothetical protein CDAR_286601 [Caerostris darwini]|uniref:Uncharacterized protein n=1 Tax=Caerostris darwini TaxID=1538125 RepID=A0AAV4UTN0_9ARAC|nr:hypothetical protein CDAR_286601 [Caerostris darwini]